MEEVDYIILHFLRQLNVYISDDANTISDLPVETIIESASKCLSTINHSIKVPTHLPVGISQRIEVAAQIASICKDLGYKNDVGYQTFLYHNETELRQVFMFLIERLPTEGKQSNINTESSNKKSLLLKNIQTKISEELNSVWMPPCCNQLSNNTSGDFIYSQVSEMISKNILSEDIMKKLQKIKDNINTAENATIETKINSEEQALSKAIGQENYVINKSLKQLQEMAIVLRQKLDTLESDRNVMDVEYLQAHKSVERVEADFKNVENFLKSIGLNDIESEGVPVDVLEKVQSNLNVLHRKSEELTSQNLSLKIEIEKIKNNMDTSQSERNKCKKILVNLKETAKAMKEEYEKQGELKDQLKMNYDKLKVVNKRSVYTKRIMEIISNVDKQNMEIKKILEDTRFLQKEINSLEGQLDRCFTIADETLFRDAKKDDQAKKAYKLLALLHSECNTIVSLVNETGILSRDIVDLEDNIKAEKAKRTEDTLKKVQLDMTKMQQESDGINH